ncbi:MAG: type II toxin-antitoxin system RelE/ParE family toxin [Flavobacteriaceae bacterium]
MNKMALVFQNSAKQDIKDIVKWYNSKKQGLGKEFYSEVKSKAKQLTTFPYSFQNRYSDVRTAVLKVFPYMLHYVVDFERKKVVILTVLHTSRNPKIWNDIKR